MKPKKCRQCREPFTPTRAIQPCCSYQCEVEWAIEHTKKKKAKEYKETKLKIKSKSKWAREAQTAFNRYIRLRDAKEPCISCGRYHTGQYHAGHYLSVGANPALRYEPFNCWKQCQPCNTHLSGNIVNYRRELINRIGPAALEWLEGPHEPKKYTIEDLQEIKKHYSKLARQLEKEQQNG